MWSDFAATSADGFGNNSSNPDSFAANILKPDRAAQLEAEVAGERG
jgi:hypothetical protein